MNRKAFICLMWLALPITALRYWLVWDRLPLRMATHFTGNSIPNGWMLREVSLYFALGITAFLLVVFTGVLLAIQKQEVSNTFSGALLGFFYLVLGVAYFANASVLQYNLTGQPITLGPIMVLVPLGIVALLAIYLGTQRGGPLPPHAWIATESHSSPVLAIVLLAPLALELWIFSIVPLAVVRAAVALMCLLFLVLAAFAWNGFQYRFGAEGIEVSTLGFRLRSIPRSQIKGYAVEPWSLLRGYGIRGVGESRAYVWCNQVVHIKTTQGDVFLGHTHPECIVRDLDSITDNQKRRE